MRHKISLFDRRRDGNDTTAASPRISWRRKRGEPKRDSGSQSDFNSIRVNTADYRSIDLLRQYDDDRINVSSVSQPTVEGDQRHITSGFTELDRCQSEERCCRPNQNAQRRQDECLFLTSGYRVKPRYSPLRKGNSAKTKNLDDKDDEGSLPSPELSQEGIFLRGKQCLLIAFITIALAVAFGLSWYFSCSRSFKRGSVHTLVTSNPVARILGLGRETGATPDARSLWINHVVKNDDNHILIAETFESRMNAEITPLLEKFVNKIWDHATSPPITCNGGNRLMIAFSMTKASSIPASIAYETPCANSPSSRNCVVKKQIADVRDLIVRLPSKSSRYMHAVRLEVDISGQGGQRNGSKAHAIENLGISSGPLQVELSDASRLALQRYCGQNRKTYSEDLMTQPISASNTRLINLYELKRLYSLLSGQSDTLLSGPLAWDSQMLSTILVDPLDHTRHFVTPLHVEQLLSQFHRKKESQDTDGKLMSWSSLMTGESPKNNEISQNSPGPPQHTKERSDNEGVGNLDQPAKPEFTLASPSPLSSPSGKPASAQKEIRGESPSFNFQLPSSRNPQSSSHENSPANQGQSLSEGTTSDSRNEHTVNTAEKEIPQRMTHLDDAEESVSDTRSPDTVEDTSPDEGVHDQSESHAFKEDGERLKSGEVTRSEEESVPGSSKPAPPSSVGNSVGNVTDVMTLLPAKDTFSAEGNAEKVSFGETPTLIISPKDASEPLSLPASQSSAVDSLERSPPSNLGSSETSRIMSKRSRDEIQTIAKKLPSASSTGMQRREREVTPSGYPSTNKQILKHAERGSQTADAVFHSSEQISPSLQKEGPLHHDNGPKLQSQTALPLTGKSFSSNGNGMPSAQRYQTFGKSGTRISYGTSGLPAKTSLASHETLPPHLQGSPLATTRAGKVSGMYKKPLQETAFSRGQQGTLPVNARQAAENKIQLLHNEESLSKGNTGQHEAGFKDNPVSVLPLMDRKPKVYAPPRQVRRQPVRARIS